MSPNDIAYYRQRAADERALAKAAPLPAIADIHLELACMYENIVELDQSPQARVHLVEVLHPA